MHYFPPLSHTSNIKFNELAAKVNRVSFEGKYEFDATGRPRNPHGRTGVTGRGRLGRFGPNHAADPVVTAWKRDETGKILDDTNGRKIMQFVAIQRKDTGEWALPGVCAMI